MTFNPTFIQKWSIGNLPPGTPQIPGVPQCFGYYTATDSKADVLTNDYFKSHPGFPGSDLVPFQFTLNDMIFCVCTDGYQEIIITDIFPSITTVLYSTGAPPPAPGIQWNVAIANTVMEPNNGYLINGASKLSMTIPASFDATDVFQIVGFSANGWELLQQAGQTVRFGNIVTTTGVGGSIQSTNRGDSIQLLGAIDDTDLAVFGAGGNLTYI